MPFYKDIVQPVRWLWKEYLHPSMGMKIVLFATLLGFIGMFVDIVTTVGKQ
jgi:hypothetical protein